VRGLVGGRAAEPDVPTQLAVRSLSLRRMLL